MAMVYETSVSHFKDQMGGEIFKRMLSFLLVDKRGLFFTKLSIEEFEIHEIFITENATGNATK